MNESVAVVVPAFDEAHRLAPTLEALSAYLGAFHPDHEIIVVDDGSTDATAAIARSFADRDVRIRLLQRQNRGGKGAAVRDGARIANKDFVLVTDADLATPIDELASMLAAARRGYDVVVASRHLPASTIAVRQPLPRRLMGATFRRLVRGVLLPGIADTQCGFKLYRAHAARTLFAEQRLGGYAFDVELLVLAAGRFRVCQQPVRWRHVPGSRVAPARDSLRMLWDVALLARRTKLGHAASAWHSGGPRDGTLAADKARLGAR